MTNGIVTKASPWSVDETVRRLVRILDDKKLKIFSIVDHSGEAERSGLHMPNTKLVIFGNPVAGTPIMLAEPLAALDLPLKLLVWEDARGAAFVSYNTPEYLSHRYGFDAHFETTLGAIAAISDAVVAS